MNELGGRLAADQIAGGRDYQEDDYGVVDGRALGYDGNEHTVLVLADGMGGHAGGDTAAKLAIREFVDAYQSTEGPIADRLRESLESANAAISAVLEDHRDLDGMGCTLVAAVISSRGLEWISVGDSLLWLYRDGELKRLNADHSMAPVLEDMVATDRITADEAASDPNRHGLRSALTGGELRFIDLASQPIPLRPEDRIILASDGILTLSEAQIVACLHDGEQENLESLVAGILAAVEAEEQPEQDNTTVMLFRPEKACGQERPRYPAMPPVVAEKSGPSPRRKRRFGVVFLALLLTLGAIIVALSWRGEDPGSLESDPERVDALDVQGEGDSELVEESEGATGDHEAHGPQQD